MRLSAKMIKTSLSRYVFFDFFRTASYESYSFETKFRRFGSGSPGGLYGALGQFWEALTELWEAFGELGGGSSGALGGLWGALGRSG